jgi:signal peptidase II
MSIYENMPLLGNWFGLHFVENEGMAFGLSWGANSGKLALTLLRIVLSAALIYYVIKKIKENKSSFLVVTIFALVIAGAIGNVLDSIFYGVIFNASTPDTIAVAFPPEGGYSGYFYGSVVDMFSVQLFPIPEWVPGFGGSWFFPAIFNVADSCVTVGIILMLIFNKRI